LKKLDEEFYDLLVMAANSCKTGSSTKESTMAKTARVNESAGIIPWGHGCLLYMKFENMFERVRQTDPRFAQAAAKTFRAATMSSKQTPDQWRAKLTELWDDCKAEISEPEFVSSFVMNLSKPYAAVKDQYMLVSSSDKPWSLDDAYDMVTRVWHLKVRGGDDADNSHDRKKERKERKKVKADRQAVQQMYSAVLETSVFCDNCGKQGHWAAECTAGQVEKWCTACKASGHFLHRCKKMKQGKGKGGGKGKGRGGGKGKDGGRGGGKGKGGKVKFKGKGKTPWQYQQQHYEHQHWQYDASANPSPAPAPAPAPAIAPPVPQAPPNSVVSYDADNDDLEYDGWQMHLMNFQTVPRLFGGAPSSSSSESGNESKPRMPTWEERRDARHESDAKLTRTQRKKARAARRADRANREAQRQAQEAMDPENQSSSCDPPAPAFVPMYMRDQMRDDARRRREIRRADAQGVDPDHSDWKFIVTDRELIAPWMQMRFTLHKADSAHQPNCVWRSSIVHASILNDMKLRVLCCSANEIVDLII